MISFEPESEGSQPGDYSSHAPLSDHSIGGRSVPLPPAPKLAFEPGPGESTWLVRDILNQALHNDRLDVLGMNDLRAYLGSNIQRVFDRPVSPTGWCVLRTAMGEAEGFLESRTVFEDFLSMSRLGLTETDWELVSRIAHARPECSPDVLHGLSALGEHPQRADLFAALNRFVQNEPEWFSPARRYRWASLLFSATDSPWQAEAGVALLGAGSRQGVWDTLSFCRLSQQMKSPRLWRSLVCVVGAGPESRAAFRSLTSSFCSLIEYGQMGDAGQTAIAKVLGTYPQHARQFSRLLESVVAAARAEIGNSSWGIPWQLIGDLAQEIIVRGASPASIPEEMIRAARSSEARPSGALLRRIAEELAARDRSGNGAAPDALAELVRFACSARLGASVEALLKWGRLSDSRRLEESVRDLKIQSVVNLMVGERDVATRKEVWQTFQRLTGCDREAFPDKGAAAGTSSHSSLSLNDAMWGQSARAMYRICDVAFGGSSLEYELREIPGTGASPLVECAREYAAKVVVFHDNPEESGDSPRFPGTGVLISNIDRRKVFTPNEEDQLATGDPYHRIKHRIAHFLEAEFNDLENVHFFFSEGVIAVSCLNQVKYSVLHEHVALVIFLQDNHGESASTPAVLIPHRVLQDALSEPALLSEGGENAVNERGSLKEARLSLSGLEQRVREYAVQTGRHAMMLKLSPAILAGGLVNAFPPGSTPYFNYENDPRMASARRDPWGHIPRSVVEAAMPADPLSPGTGADPRDYFKAQEVAHYQVNAVLTAYQNLIDWWRFIMALHNKGWRDDGSDIPNPEDAAESDGIDLYTSSAPAVERPPHEALTPFPGVHSSRLRSLHRAYDIHHEGLRRGWSDDQFPVLCVTPILRYAGPQEDLYLFTNDLSILHSGQRISLPRISNGRGELEGRLFYSHFYRYFLESCDFRFVRRSVVERWLASGGTEWV